jgi:hypothetical protein
LIILINKQLDTSLKQQLEYYIYERILAYFMHNITCIPDYKLIRSFGEYLAAFQLDFNVNVNLITSACELVHKQRYSGAAANLL